MAKGQRALLPPEDEERLQQLSVSGPPAVQKRARAILAWHEGLNANEAAIRSELTVNQVQYLWRNYRRKGLDLLMIDADTPGEGSRSRPSAPPATPDPEPSYGVSLEALCTQHHVDMAHAQHVGALALQLFDATMQTHRLPQNMRSILEAAAIVHNVAYEIDPPNHHLRGRDILLAQPLRGYSADDQRMLACMTVFHRKKVRPEAEPVYNELAEDLQRDVLALSAIFRVADGLDYSQSQSTDIVDIQATEQEVLIVLDGPHAATDLAQAHKKGDLWSRTFATPLRFAVAEPEGMAEPTMSAPLLPRVTNSPHVHEGTSTLSAGRVLALYTFDRIDSMMRQVQKGDMGILHALSREISRLIEACVLAEIKGARKELKWFAEAVDEARIAAVVSERAAVFGDDGSDEGNDELNTNGANNGISVAHDVSWQRAWNTAAREVIQTLDIARYQTLAEALRQALVSPEPAGTVNWVGYQVGPTLWYQLSALRRIMEHGESVAEALDAVRRLQDHIAAFRNLLGPEIAQVNDILSPLESYLGAIHTTQAVVNRLEAKPGRRAGRRGVAKAGTMPAPDHATEALRASQIELLERLADELSAVWQGANSVLFRRAFALAIAAP